LSEYPESLELRAGRLKVVAAVIIIIIIINIVVVVVRSRISLLSFFR
jgi:hypothetical protein